MDFRDDHPAAADAILQCHYVDDYVSCYSSVDEAINITKEVTSIHAKGGFELRNFTSNCQKVVQALNGSTISSMNMDIEHENTIDKILGLFWNVNRDTFTFQLKFSRIPEDILQLQRHPTKREMLSFAMSVYDPFGFIANLTIHIKVLVQAIWRLGTSWDEPVPDPIFNKWCLWLEQLEKVKAVNIPRCYSPNLFKARTIELHTMVDSSEVAFCAVSYLRIVSSDHTELAFVAGKTKCAPLKELSVPRLELQAAVLGCRLMNTIRESHRFVVDRCFLWSDSMTVLYWLKDDKCRFKPFVRNRVSEILDTTSKSDWFYVPTNDNVADDGTRDVYPPMFQPNSRWTNGPEWLLNEKNWPKQPNQFVNDTSSDEVQRIMLIDTTRKQLDAENYSDYCKLKRTVAWILRFVYFLKSKKSVVLKRELLPSEINRAEQYLCRKAQKESFPKEFSQLQEGLEGKWNSNLIKLMPYLDENEVMRVSGRIDNAPTVPVFTKRPIILPKEHNLSSLIMKYYHELHHHQFDELTICEVRLRFWIISARTVLQQVKKKCAFCIIRSASPVQPMMGQLPKDRLTAYVRPFSYCGVDFFGPINVAIGRRREKRWVALFTCATIRAVHLEISEDLTSDSFILCLRNFINIRGVPVRIRSDNGTNFVGAKNEMIKSAEFFGNAGIQRESSKKGIEWLFNTPGHPEAGGIWERLVQMVKRVLNPLLKDVAPKTETLRSFLMEAANIINSRPLTHLPISHQDEDPLTPNSFLLGCSNSIQTVGSFDDRLWCLRKQWRISQSLKNHF